MIGRERPGLHGTRGRARVMGDAESRPPAPRQRWATRRRVGRCGRTLGARAGAAQRLDVIPYNVGHDHPVLGGLRRGGRRRRILAGRAPSGGVAAVHTLPTKPKPGCNLHARYPISSGYHLRFGLGHVRRLRRLRAPASSTNFSRSALRCFPAPSVTAAQRASLR